MVSETIMLWWGLLLRRTGVLMPSIRSGKGRLVSTEAAAGAGIADIGKIEPWEAKAAEEQRIPQ